MKYRISPPEKFVIRILIAAVLWLSMGSLVNFHMNRIYGKELISPTLYCNRQKDKVLKEAKSTTGVSHHFAPLPAVIPETLVMAFSWLPTTTKHQTGVGVVASDSGFCLHGLRAPPVS